MPEPDLHHPDRPETRDYTKEELNRARTAKPAASATNTGAVKRMDRLRAARQDLAAAVKNGAMKGAEALRQMRMDLVAGKIAA